MLKKISIEEVNRRLIERGVPYGCNVCFDREIDLSNCTEYWGTRCDDSIHPIDDYCAHRDQYDPRSHSGKHLIYDSPEVPIAIGVGLTSAMVSAKIIYDARKDKSENAVFETVLCSSLIGFGVSVFTYFIGKGVRESFQCIKY